MFLVFTNLWARLQIFLKKAFIAYYQPKEKNGNQTCFHSHLPFKNIFMQFLTMKMERNDCQLATDEVVLEFSVMVVSVESEVPLFSYPREHFFFSPNSINPKFCEILTSISLIRDRGRNVIAPDSPFRLGQSEQRPWERDLTRSWWQCVKCRGKKFSKAYLHGNGII